jgi:hypothetical protein
MEGSGAKLAGSGRDSRDGVYGGMDVVSGHSGDGSGAGTASSGSGSCTSGALAGAAMTGEVIGTTVESRRETIVKKERA